jgi:hypothetical protein
MVLALSMLLAITGTSAHAFKFSDDEGDRATVPKPPGSTGIPAACKERLKKERVLVLVAERGNNGINADQGRYGLHFQGIDRRLQKQGMRTFSQEEIKKQVAQAEIDAHFRNDPDAALAASKTLGASLTLRGLISSRRAINPVLHINEVYVTMGFSLVGANGHVISEATASADSYSGGDTVGMALTLLNEQADALVARLLRGYCSGAKGAE